MALKTKPPITPVIEPTAALKSAEHQERKKQQPKPDRMRELSAIDPRSDVDPRYPDGDRQAADLVSALSREFAANGVEKVANISSQYEQERYEQHNHRAPVDAHEP